jgi:hypothetical protein
MTRQTIPYMVQGTETLDEIAQRFKLPSGEILSRSPRNPRLRGLNSADTAPVGLLIFVPSDPGSLLQERYNHLSRVNQVLRSVFDEQSNRLAATLAEGPGFTTSPEGFDALRALAVRHIEAMEEACRPISEINAGLVDAGEPSYPTEGMAWLLSPELLNEWHDFWATGNWRLPAEGHTELERVVFLKFNALRSRVLQQAESRVRSTVQDLHRMTGRSADG